ncbi:MAG: hypothetical protein F9K48_02380 [Candidatus Brocadia sp.]|nr:MAG: hypothetical protein F9K48_02380 [Candidatus Brocadia sp.]
MPAKVASLKMAGQPSRLAKLKVTHGDKTSEMLLPSVSPRKLHAYIHDNTVCPSSTVWSQYLIAKVIESGYNRDY